MHAGRTASSPQNDGTDLERALRSCMDRRRRHAAIWKVTLILMAIVAVALIALQFILLAYYRDEVGPWTLALYNLIVVAFLFQFFIAMRSRQDQADAMRELEILGEHSSHRRPEREGAPPQAQAPPWEKG